MRDLGASDLTAEARHTEASIVRMEGDVIYEWMQLSTSTQACPFLQTPKFG